jgi:CBS domain-containing protein
MRARDVMVAPVITVKPHASVKEVAKIFLHNRISAVPVVDDQGKVVGIVSEGDLIRRSEAATEREHPWWLAAFSDPENLAAEYVKAHARKVADVMTRNVITASPNTPLSAIATLLESHAIKRVPIVENAQLVGIVSRANLIQAVASGRKELDITLPDSMIRNKLLAHLKTQHWAHTRLLNVTVNDGVVDLWGIVNSDTERTAIRVAAESMPGVRAVNDHLGSWSRAAPLLLRIADRTTTR